MRKILFLLTLCCCFHTTGAQPQGLDAAQQAAVDKLTFAVKTVFNRLNNPDWVLRTDYYTPKMFVSYQQQGAPLGVNNNYGRVYDLKEGSSTYQKLIQPLIDHKKDLAAAKQFDSLTKIDNKIQVLSHFEIHANINMLNVNVGAQSKMAPFETLAIKGCAYSSKSKTSTNYGAKRSSYHLLFGAWDTSQCAVAPHAAHFHFKHPEKTPFIENVDVEIIGDADFVSNFVNKADWSVITNALTL